MPTTTNHTSSRTAQEAASLYNEHDIAVLPLKRKSKAARDTGYLSRNYQPEDFQTHDNIGVRTGEQSGGLTDLDLDCLEARVVAPLYVPTGMISGRKSAPHSHRFVRVRDSGIHKGRLPYKDPLFETTNDEADAAHGGMLLELRRENHFTMVPWSVHPAGETLVMHDFTEPTEYAALDLIRRVGYIASAACLIRYWSKWEGQRNDIVLALAGGMLRAGIDVDDVVKLIETICRWANDEEIEDRLRAVNATAEKIGTSDEELLTGFTRFGELIGNAKAARELRLWLGCIPPDNRVAISVADGNLNRQGDRAIAVLAETNDPPTLFVDSSGGLARVGRDAEGRANVESLGEHAVRYHLGKVVKFTRPVKATKIESDPEPIEVKVDLDVCRNIQARERLPLPPLLYISHTPIFAARSHSALQAETGYSPAARTFVDLPPDFSLIRDVSPHPSASEISEARARLDDLLTDFPFASKHDHANTVAFALLPFGHALIDAPTPLHICGNGAGAR